MKLSKKTILFILIFLVLVLWLITQVLEITKPQTTQNISPDITPSSIQISITPTEVPYTLKEPKLQVNWKNLQIINPDKQYPTYTASKLLSLNYVQKTATKLSFSPSDQKSLDRNYIWKSADSKNILLYTPKEEALNYQDLHPTTKPIGFVDTQVRNTINQLIKNLFPEITLQITNLSYFKDNYYSAPVDPSQADIVQINLHQTLNNYSVLPSNNSGSYTLTLSLYSDLRLRTFTLNNGFLNVTANTTLSQFDINKLQSLPTTSFLITTPLKLDKQSQYLNATKVYFTAKNVEPAYILVNENLSPIYLIQGNIKIDNFSTLNETIHYIAPMN